MSPDLGTSTVSSGRFYNDIYPPTDYRYNQSLKLNFNARPDLRLRRIARTATPTSSLTTTAISSTRRRSALLTDLPKIATLRGLSTIRRPGRNPLPSGGRMDATTKAPTFFTWTVMPSGIRRPSSIRLASRTQPATRTGTTGASTSATRASNSKSVIARFVLKQLHRINRENRRCWPPG